MANIMRLGGGGASGTISITTNGTHDVKKYATANVNVQSAPVLLWTNASPTSSFSSQTINVDSSQYSALIFGYYTSRYDTNNKYFDFVNKTKGSVTLGGGSGYRDVTFTDTTVTFGNGYLGSKDNERYIPANIWGVKFTL